MSWTVFNSEYCPPSMNSCRGGGTGLAGLATARPMISQTMEIDKHQVAASSSVDTYVLGTRLEGKSVYKSSCIVEVSGGHIPGAC